MTTFAGILVALYRRIKRSSLYEFITLVSEDMKLYKEFAHMSAEKALEADLARHK